MKLLNIYEGLITEFTNQNMTTVINAINDKRLLNINYDAEDGNPDGKGWRRIEPFCVGKNKFGNDCVRAWQQHGVSASYPPGKDGSNGGKVDPLTFVPGWRMFRVDKITQINQTGNETFNAPRPKYNPKDSDMVQIYAAADFGNTPGGYTGYDSNPPAAPTDPNGQIIPQTDITNNPVAPSIAPSTAPPVAPSTVPGGQSGYAHYNDTPDNNTQSTAKASKFDQWANKFKNLIGYKPK